MEKSWGYCKNRLKTRSRRLKSKSEEHQNSCLQGTLIDRSSSNTSIPTLKPSTTKGQQVPEQDIPCKFSSNTGELQYTGCPKLLQNHWGRLYYLSLLFFVTLHSDGYIFPFLFCLSLFSAICKASWDNHSAFLHFFFLGMVLTTTSCTVSQTSIHSSSGTLSHLIPWIYLWFPLYNHKGFDLGHTWMV